VCIVIVAIAGLVFFLPTGKSSLDPGGAGGPLVVVRATINASASGGNIAVLVQNAANLPFVVVSLSGINPSLSGLTVLAPFTHNESVISSSNPLWIGDTAQAAYAFTSSVETGASYTVTVSVTLTDGQVISASDVAIG
jgi:hypothetical protein